MDLSIFMYDPDFVAQYFDDFGEREWTRLVNTPSDEVKLFIHSYYLREHVRNGDFVLDIGAGAGRFTQLLVDQGAAVIVADISRRQIELNNQYSEKFDFAHGVKDLLQMDICNSDLYLLTNHQLELTHRMHRQQ